MIDKTYGQMMSEAYAFTRDMGLDTSDIVRSNIDMDIEDLSFMIWYEFYINRKYTINDFAFQCFNKSIEVLFFMCDSLNLYPMLTTGNIRIMDKMLFNETKIVVSDRLKNTDKIYQNPNLHTWLTLDTYVIDVTFYATHWSLGKRFDQSFTQEHEKPLILNSQDRVNNTIVHCPLFLGIDYFRKIHFSH